MIRSFWGITYGIFIGLLAAGTLRLVSSPPQGEPVTLFPPPTPAPIVVHITGAVVEPGVYPLPVDSRVEEAIEIAGGFLATADIDLLNLAAQLKDGDQIQVMSKTPPPRQTRPFQRGYDAGSPLENPDFESGAHKININRASLNELESLPGVGPVTAQKIVTYREQFGPFITHEDLLNVSGIGPATLERIRTLVTVYGY